MQDLSATVRKRVEELRRQTVCQAVERGILTEEQSKLLEKRYGLVLLCFVLKEGASNYEEVQRTCFTDSLVM